ncbi:MAG TPA: 30S ribosomal protein S4, partial [bacterium]|nr:30S ribosomal protein S4 [bacterium]
EGQFRRYFRMAEKSRGATGEKLLEYLERRLDNILVVSGFIDSRRQARQLIYGGNVRVNGKRVSASSYLAKTADEVEFRPGLKIRPQIKEKVAASSGQPARVVPAWVAVDKEALKIKVLREPARSEVTLPVSEGHIVNLYSR